MDRYKKKSLHFTDIRVSRDTRHAETHKARESSRFKRLSILRSMDEGSINEEKSMEPVKAVKCEGKKTTVSRLDMLFKWKQEKKIKKELEKKNIKKPFYPGGQAVKNSSYKNLQNMKLPLAAQSNTSFNTSKTMKSKLLPSSASSQPTRVPNVSKQVTSGPLFQSSKIPNSSKLIGAKSANKVNNMSSGLPKTVKNSVVSGLNNQVGSISKTTKGSSKDSVAKSSMDTEIRIKPNGSYLKTKSQESSTFPKQSSKPASKIRIPTLSSSLPKGIPVQRAQSQKPVTSMSQKTKSAPVFKLHEKITPHAVENVMNKKKGYCFKKKSNEPAGLEKKIASNLDAGKKTDEKKELNQVDSLSEQSAQSMLFDCDVSIIKRAPSFAPADFKFIPPAGLLDFSFDVEAFENIKQQFMSRTSTPSKSCEVSPSLNSKDVQDLCNEEIQADKVNDEILKNSTIEEELQNKSDVKLVTDKTEKEPAVNELPNIPEVCIDSPLDCIDLSKMKEIIAKQIESLNLDDEELNDDDLTEEKNADKFTEKKPLGAFSKRTSMLKNRPVLNSIMETDECIAESPSKSKNKQNSVVTPRRSQRLSKLISIEENPTTSAIVVTPRRSMRLQNITSRKYQFEEKDIFSPIEVLKNTPRRSMRLIDLNTPEVGTNSGMCQRNIAADFENLTLNEPENINPEFLIDFENSPDMVSKLKSKKVSLLYSPEKIRKSMRKSVRGDLMSFSPSN